MPSDENAVGYSIWGADQAAYGPVELPELVSWIKDERVTADTWVFLQRNDCWEKAGHVPELQMFFHGHSPAAASDSTTADFDAETSPVDPKVLRHVKILAGLNDEQLVKLTRIMEVKNISQGAQLVRQGEQADSMYVLLEGGLHLRTLVDGRETSLGSINAGEFIGEITLFDHGPRCADVIATQDSAIMKIPAAEFEKFVYETPDLAAPFLLAMAKTLTTRIRADNKRYRDSVSYPRAAGAH